VGGRVGWRGVGLLGGCVYRGLWTKRRVKGRDWRGVRCERKGGRRVAESAFLKEVRKGDTIAYVLECNGDRALIGGRMGE
jgi:hypothetical protein